MRDEKDTAHRLAAYSDAVFAICVALLLHLSPEVPGRLLGVRDR